jgi:hypothetical protein
LGARSNLAARWWSRQEPPHYDPISDRYCYRKVPHSGVTSRLRESVDSIALFALKDLGLDASALRISLIWAEPVPVPEYPDFPRLMSFQAAERSPNYFTMPVDLLGYTPAAEKNEVWFRSDVDVTLHFETTVIHELRHLFQKITRRDVFDDKRQAETDAHEYAFDAIARFLEKQGRLSDKARQELQQRREQAMRFVLAETLWGKLMWRISQLGSEL